MRYAAQQQYRGSGAPASSMRPQSWHPSAKHLASQGRISDRRRTRLEVSPARVVCGGMPKGTA